MMFRRHLTAIGRVILTVLLFSHAALALSACERGWRMPAEAIVAASNMPCCSESESSSGNLQGNVNLCVAHCTADAQNVDSKGHAIPALFTLGGHTASVAPAPGLFALSRPIATPRALSAPPLNILFKNLRI